MKIKVPRSSDYSLYHMVARLKYVSELEDVSVEQLKPFINSLAKIVQSDAILEISSMELGFLPPYKSFDEVAKTPYYTIVDLDDKPILGGNGVF